MFGSLALEIAISLSLLYLLLGLMCSVLNEWMAGLLNMRAKNLWEGVRNLLYDSEGTGLAKQLYDHALVKNLGKAAPSFVCSFSCLRLGSVRPCRPGTRFDDHEDAARHSEFGRQHFK